MFPRFITKKIVAVAATIFLSTNKIHMNLRFFNYIWGLAEQSKNHGFTIAKLKSLAKAIAKQDAINAQVCLDAVEYLSEQSSMSIQQVEAKGKYLAIRDLQSYYHQSEGTINLESYYPKEEYQLLTSFLLLPQHVSLDFLKSLDAQPLSNEQKIVKDLLTWRHFTDKLQYSAEEIQAKDAYYNQWIHNTLYGELP